MNHMSVSHHTLQLPRKASRRVQKTIFSAVLNGFTHGLVTMSTFGLVGPVRSHKRHSSDSTALAGDWIVVGNGLKHAAVKARIPVGR